MSNLQNRTTIIIDNRTDYELSIISPAWAAAGTFAETTNTIVPEGWNSIAGVITSEQDPKAGTAGMMTYIFTAENREQYFIAVTVFNPYGNATHSRASVALRDQMIYPGEEGCEQVNQNGPRPATINVDGKTLQATSEIDQVTDTPNATFTLSWV